MDDLLHRALELIETGNRDAADEIVEAVIEVDPKNARAWRLRAQVATEPGEKIAYLKKSLELAPQHLETREQLEALGETLPPLTLEPDDTAPIRMGKPDVNIEQTQVSSRTQVIKPRKIIEEPEFPAESTTQPMVIKEPANRRGCARFIVLLFVVVIGGGIALIITAPDQPQAASLRALFSPSATPTVTATLPPPTTDITAVPTLTVTAPISDSIATLPPTDPMAALENVDELHLFSGEQDGPGGNFGWSVDVDGDTLVVGAPGDSHTTGKVYIYTREGDQWWMQQQLSSDMVEGTNDLFGWSVALDGDRLAIGSPGDNTLVGDAESPDNQRQGATYVFTRQDGEWQKLFVLMPEEPGQKFGNAVDLDGDTLVVGAPATEATVDQGGMVFIYRPGDSPTWEKQQVLDETGEWGFGQRLALDGNRLVIPANMEDNTVYVYDFDGDSWVEQVQLRNEPRSPENRFGYAIATNGSRIAVSNLPTEIPSDNNAVTIYEEISGSWEITGRIQNPVETLSFGYSIDLEGDTLVIGAPWFGQPADYQAGLVYVFTYDGNQWVESHCLFMPPSPEGIPVPMVGWSVAVDGDQVAAGAPDQSDPPETVGGALLFQLNIYP